MHFIYLYFFLVELCASYSIRRSCTDKAQASATPKGLKDVPVVLIITALNSDVQLPCHYCDESGDLSGRVWHRRTLAGKEEEVKLDLHDDDTKNRIFTDHNHNLIIHQVSEKDAAYYFCYKTDNGTNSNAMKMDILLDVGYRSTLEPHVLELPADLGKEISKIMSACHEITSIEPISMYSCYAEWGPWSKCDTCGKVGKRKRIGECRLQKFSKVEMEASGGKRIQANFPIVGIGCHSFLLNAIPRAKKILNQIPNIVLQEKCEVSCENYIATATEMTAYRKNSFLKKINIKTHKVLKAAGKQVVMTEEKQYEGESLTLFCPGASLDTRVKWKFQNRAINPEKIKQKTSGRVSIDAMDTLHIKNLRVTDEGEYTCSLYDVEIGLVRLKVKSKYTVFDPTSNFGILTIAMLLTFVLWIILMAIKWKAFVLQYGVQERTRNFYENISQTRK